MKSTKTRNMALLLPMFYEFARDMRNGLVEWANQNPHWRLMEFNLETLRANRTQRQHLDAVVYWPRSQQCAGWEIVLEWNLPTVVCGGQPPENRTFQNIAQLTFDRGSLSQLAIDHFDELGFEVVGYVGAGITAGGKPALRVAHMQDAALSRGMEWVSHDLGELDPEKSPEVIWEGMRSESLCNFLRSCPKPIGLLAEDDYIGTMLCETAVKMGITVPTDLAVLGQGNRIVGHGGSVPLSSVILPGRKVGRIAAGMLDSWPDSRKRRREALAVPCEGIVVRQSTGGLSCDPNIERAKRFLDQHQLEGVTVNQLASVSGYSPRTVRVKLLELYGINVAQFARKRRCEEILRSIRETDQSMAEIGRQSGFGSPSAFCNFVVRNTGKTPAEHRRGFS